MNEVIRRQDVYALLNALVAVAPNGRVQQCLGQLVNEMYGAGEVSRDIYISLLQTGLDGIRYGNWLQEVVPADKA